jgi:hypothetical protein
LEPKLRERERKREKEREIRKMEFSDPEKES